MTPVRAATSLPVPVVDREPRFTAADYARVAQTLLPRGRAWSLDPDGKQAKLMAAIAKAFERSDRALSGILEGAIPGEIGVTLPEWEAALGLPDPYATAYNFEDRAAQVRARFVGVGGQSREHIIAFALALGFAIAITNYAPFRAGLSPVGNPLAGDEWSFVWGVTVLANPRGLPIELLMRELRAINSAEATVILLS